MPRQALAFSAWAADPLCVLLLFNFDVLLELAAEGGFSNLVCFLAEADADDGNNWNWSSAVQERICVQYGSLVLGHDDVREGGIDHKKVNRLQALLAQRIPFPSIFASVCEAVFARLQQHVSAVPSFVILKRINKEDRKLELSTVLRSSLHRKYYEAFQNSPGNSSPSDRSALQCWDAVHKVMQEVEQYPSPRPGPSPGPAVEAPSSSSGSGGGSSSSSSIASKGALDAMVINSGGNVVCASASSLLGETFADPLLAFRTLLVATRALQKTHFDKGHVAGISEALRMELAATLNMTSAVRTNDIESVDAAFAGACAGRLVRLLRAVERETFQHLQGHFSSYSISPEYSTSLAAAQLQALPAFVDYMAHFDFLEQRVKGKRQVVVWTDPEASGHTYLCCDDPPSSHPLSLASKMSKTIVLRATMPGRSGDSSRISDDVQMWTERGGNATPATEDAHRLRLLVMGILEETADARKVGGGGGGGGRGVQQQEQQQQQVCISHFFSAASSPLGRSLWRLAASVDDDDGQGGEAGADNAGATGDFATSLPSAYITLALTCQFKEEEGGEKEEEEEEEGGGEAKGHAANECSSISVGIAFTVSSPPATFSWADLRSSSTWAASFSPAHGAAATAATICRGGKLVSPVSCSSVPLLLHMYGYQGQEETSIRSIHDEYFGPCGNDLSLVDMVASVSLRLTLQILLLLLTNRSVLLVSQSATYLSRIQAGIPRIAWPFLLHTTHKQVQLCNATELERWALLFSSSRDKQHDAQPTVVWIATCLTSAFDALPSSVQHTLMTLQGAGSAGSSHTGVLVFDVDACRSLQLVPLFSKLTDSLLFQKLNSRSFRSLQAACQRAAAVDAAAEVGVVGDGNRLVELAFFQYLVDVLLRHLPATIYHYPSLGIVSCDVKRLLADLPRYGADIEVEFCTELAGLSSPSFLELLRRHGRALCAEL